MVKFEHYKFRKIANRNLKESNGNNYQITNKEVKNYLN